MNQPKRGRPRRFKVCPKCGGKGIRVYKTAQKGHCTSIYCECPACGKLRYVSTGDGGYWVRVRTIEDVGMF